MSPRRDWRDGALCLQLPAELFHNDGQGASAHTPIRVCRSCDVRAECLETALQFEREDAAVSHGVAGGLSAKQRRNIIRAERRNEVAA